MYVMLVDRMLARRLFVRTGDFSSVGHLDRSGWPRISRNGSSRPHVTITREYMVVAGDSPATSGGGYDDLSSGVLQTSRGEMEASF